MNGEDRVLRVPDGEIDFDENLIYTYRGELFTGVAYEDGGSRHGISEISYLNGEQTGPGREWYPSGALKCETFYYCGIRHGTDRLFLENGNCLADATYEYGIMVSRRIYDEARNLMDQFEMTPDHPKYQTLLRERATRDWDAPTP